MPSPVLCWRTMATWKRIAQFSDPDSRACFSCALISPPYADLPASFARKGWRICRALQMQKTQLHIAHLPVPAILMVNQEGHCLNDLLREKRATDHPDVRAVILNHRDFYQLAASYNVPFTTSSPQRDAKVRKTHHEVSVAKGRNWSLLARYIQV